MPNGKVCGQEETFFSVRPPQLSKQDNSFVVVVITVLARVGAIKMGTRHDGKGFELEWPIERTRTPNFYSLLWLLSLRLFGGRACVFSYFANLMVVLALYVVGDAAVKVQEWYRYEYNI